MPLVAGAFPVFEVAKLYLTGLSAGSVISSLNVFSVPLEAFVGVSMVK